MSDILLFSHCSCVAITMNRGTSHRCRRCQQRHMCHGCRARQARTGTETGTRARAREEVGRRLCSSGCCGHGAVISKGVQLSLHFISVCKTCAIQTEECLAFPTLCRSAHSAASGGPSSFPAVTKLCRPDELEYHIPPVSIHLPYVGAKAFQEPIWSHFFSHFEGFYRTLSHPCPV